jgi:hypothetical protein
MQKGFGSLGTTIAKTLAHEIQPYLQMHSPAEKGPLSTIDTWFNGFVPALLSGLDTDAAAAAGDNIASLLAPDQMGAFSGGGAGGRGATVVNITVSGNEFSARDFARKLKPELDRIVGFSVV